MIEQRLKRVLPGKFVLVVTVGGVIDLGIITFIHYVYIPMNKSEPGKNKISRRDFLSEVPAVAGLAVAAFTLPTR